MTKRSKRYFILRQLRKPIVIEEEEIKTDMQRVLDIIKSREFYFRKRFRKPNGSPTMQHTIIYPSDPLPNIQSRLDKNEILYSKFK